MGLTLGLQVNQSIIQFDGQLILHYSFSLSHTHSLSLLLSLLFAVRMAPTVCSEKKVRLAAIKEGRRRNNMSAAQANASTSAAGAVSGAEMTPSRAELSYGE